MTDRGLDWKGRRFTVEVGPVAHGGHCVARAEGRVVFVRHVLPGEQVEVEITEDPGGSFCRGEVVQLLQASPDRVEAPCPLAHPGGCGGCDWQHATGAAQRQLKAAVVSEQLRRLAGIKMDVEVEELPGGLLDWRTRARMAVDDDGHAGFRAHRSHRVVRVEQCPIAAPGTVEVVAGQTWTPGAEVEVAVDAKGQTHAREMVRAGSRRSGQPRKKIRRALGEEAATERAAGRDWRLSEHGFWQVHPEAADTFAGAVAEMASLEPGECAWDLYCGVGLFSAVLAQAVGPDGRVIAVESAWQAAQDAEANLADLPQVEVHTSRVESLLANSDLPDPQVVVLDPPRKGAGKRVVSAVADRDPDAVIYIACDPASLARDVALFAKRGLELTGLRAFDAFPMTHHVECIALLEPPA